MDYRVVVTPEAREAIDRDLAFIRRQASMEQADRWYTGLMDTIGSLSSMPTRCRVIPESLYFETELRQILYGKRHHARRIIFSIEGGTVYVVHYRHGSMPRLKGPE